MDLLHFLVIRNIFVVFDFALEENFCPGTLPICKVTFEPLMLLCCFDDSCSFPHGAVHSFCLQWLQLNCAYLELSKDGIKYLCSSGQLLRCFPSRVIRNLSVKDFYDCDIYHYFHPFPSSPVLKGKCWLKTIEGLVWV